MLKNWQKEYLLFKYKNLKEEEAQLKAEETNFTTAAARAFQAGWDTAIHTVSNEVRRVINGII